MSPQPDPKYLWSYDERRNIHPIFSSILYHPRMQQCIELVQSQPDVKRAAYEISRELSQVEEIVLSSKPGSTVLLPKLRKEFTAYRTLRAQLYELRSNDVGTYWQAIFNNAYAPIHALNTLPNHRRPESPEQRAFLHVVHVIAFMLALRELSAQLKSGNAPCSHKQTLKSLQEAVGKMQSRLDKLEPQGMFIADEYMIAALTRWKAQTKYCENYEKALVAKATALSSTRQARKCLRERQDALYEAERRAEAARQRIHASPQRAEANRRADALGESCQVALHAFQEARDNLLRLESLYTFWTAECEKKRRTYEARYEPARKQLRSEVDRALKYNERRFRYSPTSRYM